MPDPNDHRRRPDRPDPEAALIAGAASGDLSPTEQRAYDALAATDPTVETETSQLRVLLARVAASADPDDAGGFEHPPGDELAHRVLSIPTSEAPGTGISGSGEGRRARRAPLLAAAAVVLLIGGVLGGAVGAWLGGPTTPQPSDVPPSGPPGTLGAVEPIDFSGEPDEVDIDASLIAHTWGTETVLDMDGWEPGASYRLVLVSVDGDVEESGTFLGSTVQIDCRMNGALLREDVEAVEIRDDRGRVVATSDVPAVDEAS